MGKAQPLIRENPGIPGFCPLEITGLTILSAYNPLYSLAGFLVGMLVGLTGVGGGFGINRDPVTIKNVGTKALSLALAAPAPAQSAPEFSPDGRWLAYESDESGRYEAYIQRISGGVLEVLARLLDLGLGVPGACLSRLLRDVGSFGTRRGAASTSIGTPRNT